MADATLLPHPTLSLRLLRSRQPPQDGDLGVRLAVDRGVFVGVLFLPGWTVSLQSGWFRLNERVGDLDLGLSGFIHTLPLGGQSVGTVTLTYSWWLRITLYHRDSICRRKARSQDSLNRRGSCET